MAIETPSRTPRLDQLEYALARAEREIPDLQPPRRLDQHWPVNGIARNLEEATAARAREVAERALQHVRGYETQFVEVFNALRGQAPRHAPRWTAEEIVERITGVALFPDMTAPAWDALLAAERNTPQIRWRGAASHVRAEPWYFDGRTFSRLEHARDSRVTAVYWSTLQRLGFSSQDIVDAKVYVNRTHPAAKVQAFLRARGQTAEAIAPSGALVKPTRTVRAPREDVQRPRWMLHSKSAVTEKLRKAQAELMVYVGVDLPRRLQREALPAELAEEVLLQLGWPREKAQDAIRRAMPKISASAAWPAAALLSRVLRLTIAGQGVPAAIEAQRATALRYLEMLEPDVPQVEYTQGKRGRLRIYLDGDRYAGIYPAYSARAARVVHRVLVNMGWDAARAHETIERVLQREFPTECWGDYPGYWRPKDLLVRVLARGAEGGGDVPPVGSTQVPAAGVEPPPAVEPVQPVEVARVVRPVEAQPASAEAARPQRGRPPTLTDEQRKASREKSLAKYRLRQGHVPGAKGRRKKYDGTPAERHAAAQQVYEAKQRKAGMQRRWVAKEPNTPTDS